MMNRSLVPTALTVSATVCCLAADWLQYLGPNRTGVSSEEGLARSWPKDGSEVLWTFPLGPGYGGAAVSQGKVYVLDRTRGRQDVLRCIDLTTGKEDWTFAYDAPGYISHPGSRSVPVVDGDRVFTCGPFGDVCCVDTHTHKAIWQRDVWRDYTTR